MKEIIEYGDFEKLDLRIGQVIEATVPDWSRKLIELRVSFGEKLGERTIFGGVRKWYSPEDFINKKFIFIVNLAERKMGEGVSQGMMLMADENDKPRPIEAGEETEIGCVVC